MFAYCTNLSAPMSLDRQPVEGKVMRVEGA